MARVKGTVVVGSVAYLKERLGEQGYEKLLDTLSQEEAASLRFAVLQGHWYPFDLLLHLMAAAQGKVPLPPGRSLGWEMGRYTAETGLKTVYKVFFKVAETRYILKRATQLFSTYYDSGTMRVVESELHRATVQVAGFDQPCVQFCDRAQGWMERVVELTGARRVEMSHPQCAARGDAFCEYRGRWA